MSLKHTLHLHTSIPTNPKQDLEPLGVVHTTAHETNQLAPADVLQLSRIFHESKVGPRVCVVWCGGDVQYWSCDERRQIGRRFVDGSMTQTTHLSYPTSSQHTTTLQGSFDPDKSIVITCSPTPGSFSLTAYRLTPKVRRKEAER